MNIKRIITKLLFVVAIASSAHAQQAELNLSTSKDVKVELYAPIDGSCNSFHISENLEIKPHLGISYKLDVDGFAYVTLRYSDGVRYFLIVEPNDKIDIRYTPEVVEFNGSNAFGHVFNNQNFSGTYKSVVDSIFYSNYDETNGVYLDKSIAALAPIIDKYNQRLDSVTITGGMTQSMREIMGRTFRYWIYRCAIKQLDAIGASDAKGVTDKQKTRTHTLIDSIYSAMPPYEDKDVMKHMYSDSYAANYYDFRWSNLDNDAQAKYMEGYTSDTFGPYADALLAPDYIKLPRFASPFLVQLQLGFNEFDIDKMLAYITAKFPNSQYAKLLPDLLADHRRKIELRKQANSSAKFIKKEIKSFKDIVTTDEIKGQFVFIDLWASWCMPCKSEFAYNEELHELLASYGSITQVYISIDEDKFEGAWRKAIEDNNLSGYHIRAGKELTEQISTLIFSEEGSISVPRYILLDKSGNIISNKLPRPSSIDNLKNVLDDEVKNTIRISN